MQNLVLAEDLFDRLESGDKLVTIRKGRRDIKLGELLFKSLKKDREQEVEVLMVIYSKAQNVPDEILNEDGFANVDDMIEQMQRFYPDLDEDTEVTSIVFV